MKKMMLLLLITAIFIFSTPFASAHEDQLYEIGNKEYLVNVGSLVEPAILNERNGVDVGLYEHIDGVEKPVTGIEETMQIEIQAGSERKILPLTPDGLEPGKYKAIFYPTVETTYTYRLFGSLNNTPVDLSFTCNLSGMEKPLHHEEDRGSGSFGCPSSRTKLEFPTEAGRSIQGKPHGTNQFPFDSVSIVLSLLALGLGGYNLLRMRK